MGAEGPKLSPLPEQTEAIRQEEPVLSTLPNFVPEVNCLDSVYDELL